MEAALEAAHDLDAVDEPDLGQVRREEPPELDAHGRPAFGAERDRSEVEPVVLVVLLRLVLQRGPAIVELAREAETLAAAEDVRRVGAHAEAHQPVVARASRTAILTPLPRREQAPVERRWPLVGSLAERRHEQGLVRMPRILAPCPRWMLHDR